MRRLSLPELRIIRERWTADGPVGLERLAMIPTFQELRRQLDGELRRSRRYERPLVVLVVVPDADPSPTNGTRGKPGNGSTNGIGSSAIRPGNGNGHHASTANGDDSLLRIPGPYMSSSRDDGPLADYYFSPPAIKMNHWTQLRFLLLGSLLCGTLRESDVVSYAAESHEFVALLPECTDLAARRAVKRLHSAYLTRIGIGLRAGLASFPTDGLTLDDLLAHARQSLATEPIGPTAVSTDTVTHQENGGAHA